MICRQRRQATPYVQRTYPGNILEPIAGKMIMASEENQDIYVNCVLKVNP